MAGMISSNPLEILNTYFDKIILLTIERNVSRLETIKKVLNGLNYEVFLGVDGATLDLKKMIGLGEVSPDIEEIYKQTNMDYMNMVSTKPIHINQIACALSHIKIYEYISNNTDDKVLILEDDVIPVEENLQYLAETLNQAPKNWEVLYLGHVINNNFSLFGKIKYYYLTHFLYKIGIRTKAVVRKKKTYPAPFSSLLKKQGAHIGTHAYAVRCNAVKKLIKLQTPLAQVAPDLLLMDAIAKNIVTSYTSKYIFFKQNDKIHSSIWGK